MKFIFLVAIALGFAGCKSQSTADAVTKETASAAPAPAAERPKNALDGVQVRMAQSVITHASGIEVRGLLVTNEETRKPIFLRCATHADDGSANRLCRETGTLEYTLETSVQWYRWCDPSDSYWLNPSYGDKSNMYDGTHLAVCRFTPH
jgi:hypothetical protein